VAQKGTGKVSTAKTFARKKEDSGSGTLNAKKPQDLGYAPAKCKVRKPSSVKPESADPTSLEKLR